MSVQALNPSGTDMETFRGDFYTLYQREEPHPPDHTLATHVDPTKLNENIPSEVEVESGICCLSLHRVDRHTNL